MPDDVSHNDISWWSADWCEMMCRTDYQYWRSSRRLRLSVCLTRFLLSWGKQPAASLRQLRFLLRCLVLQTHGRGYVHLLRGVGVVAEGLQFAAGMKTSGRTESLGGKSAQRNNTLDRELSYTQRSEKTWRDVRHDRQLPMINIDQLRTLLLTLVQWVILRNSVVREEGGGSAVHCIDFTHQILMTTLWNVNKCSSWHCRYSSWSLLRK